MTNKAVALDKMGQRDQAIALLNKALTANPEGLDYEISNKCETSYNLGNYQEAIQWCDKELAQNKFDPWTLTYKGLSLTKLGRPDEAVNVFDNILNRNENYTWALNGKGLALIDMGQSVEAIKLFDKILSINKTI